MADASDILSQYDAGDSRWLIPDDLRQQPLPRIPRQLLGTDNHDPGRQYLEQDHGVAAGDLLNARYGIASPDTGRPRSWEDRNEISYAVAGGWPWNIGDMVGRSAGTALTTDDPWAKLRYGALAALGVAPYARTTGRGFNAAYDTMVPEGLGSTMGGRPANRPQGFWKSPEVADLINANSDKSITELYNLAKEKFGSNFTYQNFHGKVRSYYSDVVPKNNQRYDYPADFDQAAMTAAETMPIKEIARQFQLPPGVVQKRLADLAATNPDFKGRRQYAAEARQTLDAERTASREAAASARAEQQARDQVEAEARQRQQAVQDAADKAARERLWNQVRRMRLEGRSYGDVAGEVGITRNAVSGVINRMRKQGINVPAITAGTYGLSQSPDQNIEDILRNYNPNP